MANDCLWRDATRLYKDRPVASVKKQIFGIFAVLILGWLTELVQIKISPKGIQKKLTREENQTREEFNSSHMSPSKMREYMCFDNTVMLCDVFQEVLFRLLGMKWLIVGAKINPHLANILQGVIFGFMHMWNMVFQQRSRTSVIDQSIFSTIYFIYVGYLFMYTNSIFPCIITHILYNQTSCLKDVMDYEKFLKK